MTQVRYGLPTTNAIMPTPDELRRLRRYVLQEHRWLLDPADRRSADVIEKEFSRSFWACGLLWRLPSPDPRHYFSYFVDHANNLLDLADRPNIDGSELFIAARPATWLGSGRTAASARWPSLALTRMSADRPRTVGAKS